MDVSICSKCNRLMGWRDDFDDLTKYDFSSTAEYDNCSDNHNTGMTL
jgi:hypothetical protein